MRVDGIRRVALVAWPYVIVVLGLVLLGRPVVLDFYESWRAQEQIVSIEGAYDEMAENERKAMLEEAQAYDEELLAGRVSEERVPYAKQLSRNEADMMAHLVIPSLSLDLPIFHGTDENVLAVGVGHVEGSALPVGTVGGKCVLAGHSGLPNARMFDDIHSLREGDRVIVWTLGDAYAYAVRDAVVVTPDRTDVLEPEEGRDLLTLVTCTPYGVNSHRLVVTAERCEYVPGEEELPAVEAYVNRRTVPLLVGLGAVFAVACGGIVAHARRRRRTADADVDDGSVGA